jgi:hypothetical protein
MKNKVKAISRKTVENRYGGMEKKNEAYSQKKMADTRQLANHFYAGLDPARWREIADAGMIQEDNNAMANLSPKPIHREYPRNGFFSTPYIDALEED